MGKFPHAQPRYSEAWSLSASRSSGRSPRAVCVEFLGSPLSNPSIDPTSALAALMAANRRLREDPLRSGLHAAVPSTDHPGERPECRARPFALVCAVSFELGAVRACGAEAAGAIGLRLEPSEVFPGLGTRLASISLHIGRPGPEDGGEVIGGAGAALGRAMWGAAELGLERPALAEIAARIESESVPLVVILIADASGAGVPAQVALRALEPASATLCALGLLEEVLGCARSLRAAVRARTTRVVGGIVNATGEVRWIGEHPRQADLVREPRPEAR